MPVQPFGRLQPQRVDQRHDNPIAHRDRFLGRTIDWLKKQSVRRATGLLYLIDHGKSLGEFGLFLHGLRYQMAPEMQKHVPVMA
ncbi:sulfatase-like hydrolase/transferase (plasmid) [Comamonadaceae bacterium OTU4NAUVB1]|nr:sulfatase-like hydrolase/transferase [Comamonadaceae bacterium OTU4NAUVB1]